MRILIDSYRYCNDNDKSKEDYYENHIYTQEEKEKTKLFITKISEFLKKTMGEESLMHFKYSLEGGIHFFDGIGYISDINADRDIVDVYYYGKTIDEAFLNAVIDYEFSLFLMMIIMDHSFLQNCRCKILENIMVITYQKK